MFDTLNQEFKNNEIGIISYSVDVDVDDDENYSYGKLFLILFFCSPFWIESKLKLLFIYLLLIHLNIY